MQMSFSLPLRDFPHTAQLRGTNMSSPDIRAGIALLIAAISAQGKSVIDNIEQIDRGYLEIEKKLKENMETD